MKKIILVLAIMLAGFGITANAQDTQTSNEGYIGYTFLKQDVKFDRSSLRFDENTDSHGFLASYTKYVNGSATKVGTVGFIVEGGANFKDSKATLASISGGVKLQARNNKSVQPSVKALVGVARQDISRSNLYDNTDVSTMVTLGGALDFNVKENSRYKVRVGVDYLNTGFGGERQNGVRFTTGLAF